MTHRVPQFTCIVAGQQRPIAVNGVSTTCSVCVEGDEIQLGPIVENPTPVRVVTD